MFSGATGPFPSPDLPQERTRRMKLTTKAIQALKPESRRQEIKDDGCRGLYLIVQPTGARSWAVRYHLDGRVRKATVGSYPHMGLADARLAANRIFDQLAAGVDPLAAARQAAEEARRARAQTVGIIAERYLADARSRVKARTFANINSSIRLVVAAWRDRPIGTLQRRDICELVDKVKLERGPSSAVNLQSWVRCLFGWAVDRGELQASPAAGMRAPAPLKQRQRVLTDDELRAVWSACDAYRHPFSALVQLLLLTGCRRNELADLAWSELDLAQKVIIIPPGRTKTGRAQLVPLSEQALAIISALPQTDDCFVLSVTAGKPLCGFNQMKKALEKKIDPALDPWTLHDLRRTCRTGLSRLKVPEHIAERCLGHAVRGIERTYNVHDYQDEKAAALTAWGGFVDEVVSGQRGRVIALRG